MEDGPEASDGPEWSVVGSVSSGLVGLLGGWVPTGGQSHLGPLLRQDVEEVVLDVALHHDLVTVTRHWRAARELVGEKLGRNFQVYAWKQGRWDDWTGAWQLAGLALHLLV